MEKIKITEYRNFTIYFHPDLGTFSYTSDRWDTSQGGKKSFTTVKEEIDAFIKENSNFQPFLVHKPSSYSFRPKSSSDGATLVKGVREDGTFVGSNGEILSTSRDEDTFLVLPENEAVFAEMVPLIDGVRKAEKALEEARIRLSKCQNKLKLINLKQHRKTLKELGQIN